MTNSEQLYERACKVIPGGVNSPVRAFKSVGGKPLVMVKGEGAFLYDADGKQYIDYVGSWGPLILGHAHPAVVKAIQDAAEQGTSFGWATEREIEMAEWVTKTVPSIEKIRFVNSGTEATMSALRLARGFTKRDRVLKFSGCYHGHADVFLSAAGSGIATLGIPDSAGVPTGVATDAITVQYNELDEVEAVFKKYGDTIAAVIVEPVACNMGLVKPRAGFLQGLRDLCNRYGSILIFDEVITGFRLGLTGAQGYFNIRPDLTTFGKIIGGGLPVGAYGGRQNIMDKVAPMGPVYQAGTLSGNPLAMAAGLATLKELQKDASFYKNIAIRTEKLTEELNQVFKSFESPAKADCIASIFYCWFKPGSFLPPQNYETIKTADSKRFSSFFHAMIQQGIAVAPSAFEVGFVSASHTDAHLQKTIECAKASL